MLLEGERVKYFLTFVKKYTMSDFIDPFKNSISVSAYSDLFSECTKLESVPDLSEAKECLPMLKAMADALRALK